MKNKLLLMGAAASALLTFNTYAGAPKPGKCPSISAIESAGLTYARKLTLTDGAEHWVAFQPRNSYDTEQDWGFFIGAFDDNDEEAALKSATASVASMQLLNGPFENSDSSWGCFYANATVTVMAMAITPPEAIDFPSLSKKLIKR